MSSQLIQGKLDNCDKNGIRGWAMNITNPNEPVELAIFIDGSLAVQSIANVFRQDLLDARIGNGKCAFHVPIPDKFFDGIEHEVEVKEIITKISLTDSPKKFTLKTLKCYLDACDDSGIRGWVIDVNKPNEPVEIEIFIDGELITKTVANVFRQDLFDAGVGNGKHGFQVPMPDKFWDGIEHSVTVHDTLTKTVVGGLPKIFKIIRKSRSIDNRSDTKLADTLRNKNIELEKENALLLSQLHKIQEELESYYLQGQKANTKIKELTIECNEQRSQILTLTQERDENAGLLTNIKSQFEQTMAILNIKK